MSELSRGDIDNYCASLDMGTALRERSLALFDEFEEYLPEPIERVFVSEYRDAEGNRIYESIWFLADKFLAEAHEITAVGFGDIVPLIHGLSRVKFSHEHFEFTSATDQSRMMVEIALAGEGISGDLRASAQNCLNLYTVFREYLLPRLASA